MKVLLKQSVPGLGQAGEVKNVRPGHARNYLLPNGLAILASPTAVAKALAAASKQAKAAEALKAKFSAAYQMIQGQTVTVTAQATPEGKLYGSITDELVRAELVRQAKVSVPADAKAEPSNIKQLGRTEITWTGPGGHSATMTLEIKRAT